MAMNDDWKNDPKLKEIDKTKLDMLQNLAEKGNGKSVSDMMPYLMSAADKNDFVIMQNTDFCGIRKIDGFGFVVRASLFLTQ